MSIFISAHQLSKTFGARPLFQGLTFAIESEDRIGLIGPNGAGKSTLLRILASEEPIDSGTLSFQKGLKIGYLNQVPTFKPGATLLSAVMESTPLADGWEEVALAEEYLSKLSLTKSISGFDPSTPVETLSGGWKKRVALARELVRKPDLLLLDEPTNHLDLDSILWLEDFLAHAPFATLTITHDRAFLQKVSNRIIELDRRNLNGLLNIKGPYTSYLEIKNQTLAAQKQQEIRLSNTLRRETEWLRRGAKARTTKQQARIQRAEDLKQEVTELGARNLNRTVRMEFQNSAKSPKKLMEIKGLSKAYSGKKLFENFDLMITPGSRIGILGKNGTGKSTLIRILLEEEEPDQGDIFRSDYLKIAYFQQNRETLDPQQTVLKTLCPTGDHVVYQGKSIHIRSYLDRFLFEPAQMEMTVGKLSGGEQSRILVAQLMLKEANLLVLDEPTNDLDLATLNVLEDCLVEFEGAILLVTHDRYFLDQIANQILAFPTEPEENPQIQRFADLFQWEEWRLQALFKHFNKQSTELTSFSRETSLLSHPSVSEPSPPKKRKLTFKEQRELDQMEESILQAESAVAHWTEESTKPENISHPKRLAEITQSLAEAQKKVEALYQRWSKLSE